MNNHAFTTINHIAKKELGLNFNEYVLCDAIFQVQVEPEGDGWCAHSDKYIADFLGVTDRWIRKLTNKLVECELIEKRGIEHGLRCTQKWYETAYISKNSTVGTKFHGDRNKVPEENSTVGTKFQPSEQSSYLNDDSRNKVPTSSYSSNTTRYKTITKHRFFIEEKGSAPHDRETRYIPTPEYKKLLESFSGFSRQELGHADINLDRYLFAYGNWSLAWRRILQEQAYNSELFELYSKFVLDTRSYKISDFIKAMQNGLPEAFRTGQEYGEKTKGGGKSLQEQMLEKYPELSIQGA